MRWGLAALALLAALVAGCVSFGDAAVEIQEPSVPEGLFVTYEVTQDENASTETFLVERVGGEQRLLPFNATPGFKSPFLTLDEALSPTGYAWDGLFGFPLESGSEHAATAAAKQATVNLEATTFTLHGDEHAAIEATLTSDDETIGSLTVLQNPTVLAHINITRENGVHESWSMTRMSHDPGWNSPPAWEKGDWWSYDATTHTHDANLTLIYNEDTVTTQGSPQRVLNAQYAESRPASVLFNVLRDSDIAPQSGMLNDVLATFWDWPLDDGKVFTGTGSITGPYIVHIEQAPIVLPNDRATTAFVLTASDYDDPKAEPFASWTYAPHIGFITEFWVHDPDKEQPRFDWELTGAGTGFHGEIEVPHLPLVHQIERTTGPLERSDTFTVEDRSDRLRLSGWFVHNPDTEPRMNLTVEDPHGEMRWSIDEASFTNQFIHLEEVVRPISPGEWTLTLDIDEGVSFFLDIQEVWIETQHVDYR